MTPHVQRVEQLFTAARRMKTFKTFKHLFFHNCVYEHLYVDFEQLSRTPTHQVLADLTPQHRVFFVGDASMAPYELFSDWSWYSERAMPGIEWLRRFKERCPASVWLNPDPVRFWQHPTVTAIKPSAMSVRGSSPASEVSPKRSNPARPMSTPPTICPVIPGNRMRRARAPNKMPATRTTASRSSGPA